MVGAHRRGGSPPLGEAGTAQQAARRALLVGAMVPDRGHVTTSSGRRPDRGGRGGGARLVRAISVPRGALTFAGGADSRQPFRCVAVDVSHLVAADRSEVEQQPQVDHRHRRRDGGVGDERWRSPVMLASRTALSSGVSYCHCTPPSAVPDFACERRSSFFCTSPSFLPSSPSPRGRTGTCSASGGLVLAVQDRHPSSQRLAGEAILGVAQAGEPIRPADIMPMPPMMLIATAPVRGKRSQATASIVGQKNVLPTP